MHAPITSTSVRRTRGRLNGRVRVFIVDDHPAIRMAVADTLIVEPSLEVCGEASSAEEALPLIAYLRPCVAIVDLSLADMHGLDLIDSIRTHYPETAVVVYSMYDEHAFAERALRAGASGYVMKSEPTRSLIDAVRSVLNGDIYLSRRVASQILGKLMVRHSLLNGPAVDHLTDREMEVFQLLGEGASMNEISERLHVGYKTVETYRRRARKKLGFRSVNELLQFAIRWKFGTHFN